MADKALKPAELRQMSDEQLELTLRDTTKHLFQLRFQSATERTETPSEIRKARRDVARILTVKRQRELAAAKTAAKTAAQANEKAK
jgi:large subunit ribosomal protein L29